NARVCIATSAAWRQPAGKGPCQRPANALASARTFGAKHSRGLPPNRSAAAQPHRDGLKVRNGLKVHGTCSENPREFIGIRIILCNTGDSPRSRRHRVHGCKVHGTWNSPRQRTRQRAHLRCETQPGASVQPLSCVDPLHRDKACTVVALGVDAAPAELAGPLFPIRSVKSEHFHKSRGGEIDTQGRRWTFSDG
ncbi:MAG: hypothetical protein ACKO2L_00720, partial [Planctomycetaceae bacterium]